MSRSLRARSNASWSSNRVWGRKALRTSGRQIVILAMPSAGLVPDVAVAGVDQRPSRRRAGSPGSSSSSRRSWASPLLERSLLRMSYGSAAPAARYPRRIAPPRVPRDLRPMLAVPATDLPPDDARWAYEMKWDGMRALVGVERGDVWATSRAGNDATARFPELAGLGGRARRSRRPARRRDRRPRRRRGTSASSGCNRGCRPAARPPSAGASATKPVVYMVFDVLWLDGHSTCELPYTDRRAVLERLGLAGPAWQTPPTAYGTGARGARDRPAARARGRRRQTARQHLPPREAGRRMAQGQAHPRPGARGRRLAPGRGTARTPPRFAARRLPRHGRTAATSCASPAASAPASTVPSAIALETQLRPLRRPTSPFVGAPRLADAVWVEPELVVEVAFHEWTSARRPARAALPRRTRRQARGRRRTRDLTASQYRPGYDRRSRRARRHRAGGAGARRRGVAARARRRRARRASTR